MREQFLLPKTEAALDSELFLRLILSSQEMYALPGNSQKIVFCLIMHSWFLVLTTEELQLIILEKFALFIDLLIY